MFLMLAIVLFMVSCESKTYADIQPAFTNPTYSVNIKPVISANCLSCHNGDQFPNLSTYEQLKTVAQNGNFLCKINGTCGEVMPPTGKMPQSTVDMLNLWVKQGCVN